jgi:hypothetical protein
MEGNNTEETLADLTYTDLARFPSSFKKRLLLSIKIMELMQSTGELDEKGVNFSAIGQDLFNTSTWAVWKRVRKDLPDSLLTKPYALQEQLTFLLTVHNSTVLLQSKEEELVSSDTEAERRELYRNRQSVMKLRRELSSPRTSQSSDEGQSSDSEGENIGSNSNELLQSAIANASERNNLVYRRRWKRKLAYFTDLYNRGDFKASEESITLDPADLKGSSVAAAVMSTLKSPLPAASKHKQSKRNQPSLASSSRAFVVKSSETIASQKLTSGSSKKAGAKVAASMKAIMKELNSSSDDGESSSEADEVADESSQNDDNSSDDSAANIAKMPNKSSSASNKSAGAMISAASAATSQTSHPQKSLSNSQKSFESSETNSDSTSDSDSYSSSDDSISSKQVAPTAKKVLSSPTQSASGKSTSKILAAVSGQKRPLAVVDSSSDTFSDTESGSESGASSSSFDENAHPTRPRPQTTVATVPQKKPSAKPAPAKPAPGDSSMKTSGTSASKSMGPPNKKNSSSASSPALDPGTSVKINDHKTIPSKDSKRKPSQTLPDHHNKKVKR